MFDLSGNFTMSRIAGVIFILIFISNHPVCAGEKITIYTEEFPPFQYTQNGKIIGASAEIVLAIMKKTGLDFEIKSYPWARSYRHVQENPDSLIFSISRRSNRENLFHWVGIIVPSKNSVFSLKSRNDIQVLAIEDMKKYKIGTTIDDARESFFLSQGFKIESFDRNAGENANVQNYMKLKKHRIDLWPMPDAVAFHIVRNAGDDPGQTLRKILFLEEISTGGYYLAANLHLSQKRLEAIIKALAAFVQESEYQDILAKWGLKD